MWIFLQQERCRCYSWKAEAFLQDRKKKVWKFGKLRPAAFTFSFQQVGACCSWENRRLPFTELAPSAPSGHPAVSAGLPSGSWSLFVFFWPESGDWSLAKVSRGS